GRGEVLAVAYGVRVDLGKLAAGHVVVGQEAGRDDAWRRGRVAADRVVGHQPFHVDPEGVAVGHVAEGLAARRDHVEEAADVGDHLAELTTRYRAAGQEAGGDGAGRHGRVAIDDPPAGQAADVDVERVAGVHVAELERAGR